MSQYVIVVIGNGQTLYAKQDQRNGWSMAGSVTDATHWPSEEAALEAFEEAPERVRLEGRITAV